MKTVVVILCAVALSGCGPVDLERGTKFMSDAGMEVVGWSKNGGGCATAVVKSFNGRMGTAIWCGEESFRWSPLS